MAPSLAPRSVAEKLFFVRSILTVVTSDMVLPPCRD